jgi:photosystem II stability/assembly factor-like uncharacterized protein
MSTRMQVLVGTRKGAFIYTSDEKRQGWEITQPLLAGWEVFHMMADARSDPRRLYAAANNPWWGPSIAKSTDGGKTWDQRSQGLGFPPDMGLTIENVWFVKPGHDTEPGAVYAGTQPAGLFRSEDYGESWSSVDSINRHEFRSFFQGIGESPQARSPLHSIEIDPRDAAHMYVAVSGGGSYETKDGAKSWQIFSHRATPAEPRKEMFVSQALSSVPPGVDPAAVWDMHTLVLDTKNPDRLWTQAHTGVFRSDDGGQNWEDVTPSPLETVVRPAAPTPGLLAFHGFPIAVTRREPDAAFLLPLQADDFRACPGQFAVYRTRDGGRTWQPLTNGLPGPHDYQSAYREGMDTDGLEPEGVYVGTSNGAVYASIDGGDRWQRLPGTLPPILSVTCAVY